MEAEPQYQSPEKIRASYPLDDWCRFEFDSVDGDRPGTSVQVAYCITHDTKDCEAPEPPELDYEDARDILAELTATRMEIQ